MTTLRQAAQQALEALEQRDNATLWHQAIHALRDALAQEEQEPVAWMTHGDNTLPLFHKTFAAALCWGACPTPLYTHPPRHAIEKAYESACKIIDEQDKKLAELEAVNTELLEALKFYGSSCDATESTPCGYEGNLCCKRARAAIAKAEGQK
jgi:hypothetical protein